MAEPLRMIPPKGKDSVPVFNPAGQSMRVYRHHPTDEKEGTVVGQKFKKQALLLGCIFVGDVYDEDDELALAKSPQELIVDAIEKILSRDDAVEIENDGRPKMEVVKREVGFAVTRAQLTSAWAVFEATLV